MAERKLSQFEAEALKLKVDQQVKDDTVKVRLSQLAYAWDHGLNLPSSKAGKATKPYKQLDLVFACVEKIISGILGLPAVLSNLSDTIIESGPVYDFLFNNPKFNWERFVTDTIGHWALSRDVFWVFTDMEGRRPLEVMVVSGTQMNPITHNRRPDGNLIGWEFRGTNGRRAEFDISEVWQWRNFNPYDRFHGIGPATAAKNDIDYDYAAALFNASCLANGAEMGLVLSTEQKITEEEAKMLRSRLDSRHQGPGNPKRTAVLSGGLKPEKIAQSMVDLDVAKLTENSAKRLVAAFDIPAGVINLITETQYAHGPAQQQFIFNNILPLANNFAGQISRGIISRFRSEGARGVKVGESKFFTGNRELPLKSRTLYRKAFRRAVSSRQRTFLWFDIDQHPTVQQHKQEQAEKVLKFTESGVPLNSLIEAHELPYPKTAGGKYNWRTMGEVPEDYTLEAGMEGFTEPQLAEGEGEPQETSVTDQVADKQKKEETNKTDEDERRRRELLLWDNWKTSWQGLEREYQEAMRKFFLRQQRILIKKLQDAWGALKSKKISKGNADDIIARVVFDLKTENGKITAINHTYFEKGTELGIRQTLTELLGLSGEALEEMTEAALRRPAIQQALLVSSHKIKNVNRTTQSLVANRLRKGIEEGEDLKQLTDRVKRTLGSNRNRAQGIARTQTGGAVSTGRHTGNVHAGVEKKRWVTSGDGNVRDSHVTAGRQEPIPLNQKFKVGTDRLMYPGDPRGSAAEIINCRCVEIAVRSRGKSFGLAFYSHHNFYSYSNMKRDKTA